MKAVIAYFWPFFAYHDVGRGTLMERAAAWRYNRQLANSLPLYIKRWAISAALTLILLNIVPVALERVLAVVLTVSVCGLLHLVRMWLVFRRGPF